MGSDTAELFATETDAHEDTRAAQARRLYALGGLLQVVRAQRRWSIEVAAANAGIGHMTWRRAEQGAASRLRTYAALDRLLGLQPGTVQFAVRDDALMVDLADRLGVDVTDAHNMGATEWVAKMAETAASATPAGQALHRDRAAAHPDLPHALAALAQHTPSAVPTDLQLAVQLVERLQGKGGTETSAAVQAVLRALPELIGSTVREAEKEIVHAIDEG